MAIIGSQTGANAACGALYPARMRTSGIGWALGIGRLGGIAAPMLGGWLLSIGLAPRHIFLSACVFALIAAVATALLAFRGERGGGCRGNGGGVMKVFVFDLLAYDANLDHLKGGETELPYPLAKRHFDAGRAVRTYEEHLDAWEALDRFGYDGVGFNEHHCSPYGLMNSPNLMASAAAQRTKRLKLLIYGNLLPLHEPLRLAEELAMIDCMSNGRLISGFARGIPREYQVHNVKLAELARPLRGGLRHHHPRLDRGGVLLRGPVLVVQGRRDVAAAGATAASADLGAGDRQQGIDRVRRKARPADHPGPRPSPAGCATTSSGFYAKCLAASGHRITPTICRSASPPMSPIRRRRRSRNTGRTSSTSTARCSATATSPRPRSSARPAMPAPPRPITCGRRTSGPRQILREDFRQMTMADLERQAETMPMGTADEVAERIIAAADSAGANQVQLAINRGALPHEFSWPRSNASPAKSCPACKHMK